MRREALICVDFDQSISKESKTWLAALTDTILDNYSKGVNKMIEKVQEMEQEFATMEENSNLKVYYWHFRVARVNNLHNKSRNNLHVNVPLFFVLV